VPTPAKSRQALAAHREWLLRGAPGDAQALAHAGFAAMSIANNHVMDYGPLAMRDTIDALHGAGIAASGAGDDLRLAEAPAFFERAGVRFALLGVSEILPRASWATAARAGVAPGRGLGSTTIGRTFIDQMAGRVRALRRAADVVIVYEHWGTELLSEPTPDQRAFAHAMVDAGAQLVLGAHPHVLGPIERYRDGLIVYSLGNFVFGAYPGITARSAVLRVRFAGDHLRGWEAVPVTIAGGAPRPAGGADARAIAQSLGVPLACNDGLRMPGACVRMAGSQGEALHHHASAS
ncbi:MAG: CapA family protein, partial [bacterium]|nr:CapA family protein [bacterium]